VLLGGLAFDVAKRLEGGRALTQVAFCNAIFVAATLIPVLAEGFSATPASIAWMVGIGLVGGAGQFCLYDAARRLPAPVLAALEYTSILSAFALGYLMFGERRLRGFGSGPRLS
jgi:drug/metabolite transporter (DMT)-like permease